MYWRRGSTTSPIRIGEHLVGFDRVIVVQIDLQQFALLRIHRGVEQLLGVHFAETFETLDLHSASADLHDLLQDFRDGKERMRNRLFPFAFDQLKDRLIAGGVVIDLQTFAGQFGDQFLNRGRFVQLDQLAAPAVPIGLRLAHSPSGSNSCPISASKRFRSRFSS